MPPLDKKKKHKRKKKRETPCGEAITALREKAKLTVDAVTMGKFGEGTVSKGHYSQYECGTLKPNGNTLAKILDAIYLLNPDEVTHEDLLKVRIACGCYDYRLPDEKAIDWARENSEIKMREFPGPAYLIKCRDIPVAFNHLAFKLFGADERPELPDLVTTMPIHDLLFDRRTHFIDFFEDAESFLWHNYCTTHQNLMLFRAEEWCVDFVREIASKYDEIGRIWRRIESSEDLRTEDHSDYVMRVKSADGASLQFYRSASALRDIRFYLIRWHAADGDTLQWIDEHRELSK